MTDRTEAMDKLIAQDADLIEICPDDLVLRLRYLAEEWFEMCDDIHKPLYEAAERIEALTAENERLRKALRFYADAKNWAYVKSAGCNCIDADGGDTARAALEARGFEIREKGQ